MAHELAHVVQDGGALRREIHTEKPAEVQAHLAGTYMSKSISRDGNKLTSSNRKDSGDIEDQCAQNMLASPRRFRLGGSDTFGATTNLDAHIQARAGVVDMAKAIRLDFTVGKPKLEPKLLKLIDTELTARLKRAQAFLEKQGKTPKEISDILDKELPGITLGVFNDLAGTQDFQDEIDQILKKSEEFDKGKTKGAYDYATACYLASNIVFFGGAQGEVAIAMSDTKSRDETEKTTAAWTDWVPGDWGYIKNSGTKTPAPGLEGENIISVGDKKFWAHFDPKAPIQSLPDLFTMVKDWDKSAELKPKRKYPAEGLVL